MAKLTSPKIMVTFTELGITAITRGDKGTVALILREDGVKTPFAITQANLIPEGFGKENIDCIKRAFLGYVTPPKKVIVFPMASAAPAGEEPARTLQNALDYMQGQVADYICGPLDCTKEEAGDIASWVKSQRLTEGSKIKAVLPELPADSYPIVNFCGTGMTDGDTVWSPAEYCSRIAGALAGTPMKISATYCPLPELTGCDHLSREAADEAVGAGKLVLRWDGRQVKLNRAVNSLITTSQGMLDSFKKIKLVEIMDLIRTDISQTCEDDYVGKFANSYDNKMLLVTAIRGYLMGLARDSLIKTGYTVELDTEAIAEYLLSRGTDTEGWDVQKLKEADTGSHVFILVRCKILDAIEDIIIRVEI